jgi:hypothetical protein
LIDLLEGLWNLEWSLMGSRLDKKGRRVVGIEGTSREGLTWQQAISHTTATTTSRRFYYD